jgi:hypothetical protein
MRPPLLHNSAECSFKAVPELATPEDMRRLVLELEIIECRHLLGRIHT